MSLRSFMFERVYLGEHARGEHARAHRVIARIFEHLVARGDDPDAIVEFVSGMTDRFALALRGDARLVARIKDASVEAVKQAADIVALVEARTRLRKVGGRYTGLCPFHQEKTPSFSRLAGSRHVPLLRLRRRRRRDLVRRGERGRRLRRARSSGSPTASTCRSSTRSRRRRPTPRAGGASGCTRCSSRRRRSTSATSGTARPASRCARTSRARGLEEPICREFRLGLSPGGNSLVRKAREKGFTQDELAAAGLVSRRGGDYFANRLMFPLADARGRVVGFQARKLREDDPLRGKYVNSPEGELFHKSAILYGLHLARAAIAKQDRALVVEGNTDVIALRQAGLEPVVASMGTALTEQQLKELVRLTQRLFLCFDADAAGEEATLRGMELALQRGFDVKVVSLPKGKDPGRRSRGLRGAARRRRAVRRAPRPARARPRRATGSVAYLRVQESSTACPSRRSGRRRGGC